MIVVAAHVGGRVAIALRQPKVLGEITAGILLGPSALGALWPEATEALFPEEVFPSLRALSQIGLVLFMFLVGLGLDHAHLEGKGGRAVAISLTSIAAPFALGVGLGYVLHEELAGDVDVVPFALFIGAAMAVTAFPVLARILQDTGLESSTIGVLALACAAVDDVAAWCILAVVVAVAEGSGAMSVLTTVGASVAFAAVMIGVVRPLLARRGGLSPALAVGFALGSAWVTEVIGIHAIFGAFLAGAVLPSEGFSRDALAERLELVVGTLLLPTFFMIVGFSTELGLLGRPALWGVLVLVLLAAIAGKLGGATIAALATGATRRDAVALGILLNTRGLTEIVILTVGLELGILSPTMFTIMVIMALATTYMAVPLLGRVIPEQMDVTRSRAPGRSGSAPASD